MPKLMECPSCGAGLDRLDLSKPTGKCQYCGAVVAIPDSLRTRSAQPDDTDGQPFVSASNIVIDLSGITRGRSAVVQPRRMSCLAVFLILIIAVVPTGLILYVAQQESGFVTQIIEQISQAINGATAPTRTPVRRATEAPMIQTAAPTLTAIAQLIAPTTPPEPSAITLTFGGEGTGNGKMSDGRALAVDRQGNVFVADYTTARIQRFTEDGKYAQTYTTESRTKNAPNRCLEADRKGTLYVCRDGEIKRVNIESGEQVGRIAGTSGEYLDNVILLSNGNLAALSMAAATDDLIIYNTQGRVVRRVKKIVSSQTDNSQTLLDLAADGVGNLYIVSHREKAVFRYTPDGRFVDRFGDDEFSSPSSIAVDSKGRVFVGDSLKVLVFTAEGKKLYEVKLPSGGTRDMAFNDADKLFVSTSTNQIVVIDTNLLGE